MHGIIALTKRSPVSPTTSNFLRCEQTCRRFQFLSSTESRILTPLLFRVAYICIYQREAPPHFVAYQFPHLQGCHQQHHTRFKLLFSDPRDSFQFQVLGTLPKDGLSLIEFFDHWPLYFIRERRKNIRMPFYFPV